MSKKILFICLGNICRSCAAEEVLRVKAGKSGLKLDIDSAGMIDYHEGDLPDPRMRNHAFKRGYKLTHHSRLVKPSDFRNFDLIVAMDHNNEKGLRRLASTPEEQAKIVCAASYIHNYDTDIIPDPYYGGDKDFEYALDLIEDCCDGLIKSFSEDME
jgi:protein-tyrosine phosphatase